MKCYFRYKLIKPERTPILSAWFRSDGRQESLSRRDVHSYGALYIYIVLHDLLNEWNIAKKSSTCLLKLQCFPWFIMSEGFARTVSSRVKWNDSTNVWYEVMLTRSNNSSESLSTALVVVEIKILYSFFIYWYWFWYELSEGFTGYITPEK